MRAPTATGLESLPMHLRAFKLPSFAREYAEVATRARSEGLTHEQYLLALAEIEAQKRSVRRIQRLLEASNPVEIASFPQRKRSKKRKGNALMEMMENAG